MLLDEDDCVMMYAMRSAGLTVEVEDDDVSGKIVRSIVSRWAITCALSSVVVLLLG